MKRHLSLIAAATALATAASAQTYGQQPGYGPGGIMDQQPQPYSQQTPYGQPSPYGQPGYGTPAAAGYQSLSGQWYFSSQQFGTDKTPWLIQVSPNGQLQGTQQTPRGPLRLQGQFNGLMASAIYSEPYKRAGGKSNSANVRLQFDGQCHVQIAFVDQRGQMISQATFHVNHKANEPCPN